MKIKPITIIITNYNGANILPQNLPEVIKHTQKYNAPIIIVDDASSDNSVATLSQLSYVQVQHQKISEHQTLAIQPPPGKVTLLIKEKNEGFSSTTNVGVRHAQTELVCLLNSDVIPTENFLDPIFPYFDDLQTAAVGMLDLSDDGDTHGRGKFIFHKGFILHQKLAALTGELQSGTTGWVSGGSGVFSKKIWDTLGGLDEILNPFYFEDVDYGYRAWKSNYTLYFESKSVVKHVHNTGAIKSNFDVTRIKTISYRNQLLFNWKNLTTPTLIAKHILLLLPNYLIALKNNDKAYTLAFMQAINKLSQVKLSKEKTNKYFKLTDQAVLDRLTT